MALAKPVVAFAVGGVVEMLDHGATGELVPFEADGGEGASPAAIDRLAGAIVRYAGAPARREAEGRAARARVLVDFDATAHAARIQDEILLATGLARPVHAGHRPR